LEYTIAAVSYIICLEFAGSLLEPVAGLSAVRRPFSFSAAQQAAAAAMSAALTIILYRLNRSVEALSKKDGE
jgi:hypothetical protein